MTTTKMLLAILVLCLCACSPRMFPELYSTPTPAPTTPTVAPVTSGRVEGRITQAGTNAPIPLVFVQARNEQGVTVSVLSNGEGRYAIPDLPIGTYTISSHGLGFEDSLAETARVATADPVTVNIRLTPASDTRPQVSGAEWLSLLPDDTQTRQFILDCQGCHQLGWVRKTHNGWPTQSQWESAIQKMNRFYGPQSGFPIIGPLDVEELAAWLAEYLADDTVPPQPLPVSAEAAGMRITEYDFPGAGPHDLVLDQNGQVIITGMFNDAMYSLDPASGEFTYYMLPSNANPRALELDAQGNWWIVFGSALQLARFDPLTSELDTYPIGMYAHSIALDSQGNAWANGHFLADPGKVIRIDAQDGSSLSYDIPDNNTANLAGLPISYDLRIDANDIVWGSDLNWNRIFRLDPQTGEVTHYELPHDTSGPRRFDFDSDGNLWIPEFSGGRLARFNPETETFTEWDVPTRNAEPYVVKVDRLRGLVWIGYAAGNKVASFDLATETFVEYPLPTPFALIRHMAIDEASGDVWFSYHHVPTAEDKIVRLETNRVSSSGN